MKKQKILIVRKIIGFILVTPMTVIGIYFIFQNIIMCEWRFFVGLLVMYLLFAITLFGLYLIKSK